MHCQRTFDFTSLYLTSDAARFALLWLRNRGSFMAPREVDDLYVKI
jgi:hypothetical protein